MRTPTLVVQIRLPLVRIEYVSPFKIWYCKLFVEKLMKGRQKVLFSFLFSLRILSVKSFLKIWAFPSSLLKVSTLLYFAIIFNNWRKSVIKFVFLSVSTVSLVKYCQKLALFTFLFLFHFVIVFYSLYSHPLPASLLLLIVLNNAIKNINVRKTWSVKWYQNRELHNPRDNRNTKLYWKLSNS